MDKDIIAKSTVLNNIIKNARDILYRWGYKEVFLPTIAKYKPDIRRGLKFIYCNEIYLIKPDATSRIFHSISKKSGTYRLFYISEVLENRVKGEFQLGIEAINTKDSKIEIMLVILSVLDRLGIKNFYIDIGSLKVWKENAKDKKQWETILMALKNRDFEIIESGKFNKNTKEKLWKLFNFRGKFSEYKKLNDIVKNIGDPRIFIDFGTMRPLTYYDDLVFEIYTNLSGKPIGGGGDYILQNGTKGVGVGLNLDVISNLATIKPREKVAKLKPHELKKAYEIVKKGGAVKIGD